MKLEADPLHHQRFGDGIVHCEARVERLVGILKDHLHPAAKGL
jgi:hypothetical protein